MATKTWDGDTCKKKYQITLSNGTTLIGDSTAERWSDGPGKSDQDIKDVRELERILERMLKGGESESDMTFMASFFAHKQIVRASVPLSGLTAPIDLCFVRGTSERR